MGRCSWVGFGVLALGGLVVAGCTSGSSASPGPAAQAGQAGAVSRTCQEVEATLSQGPDPTADPVGYAEAQILPLRRIHTSDTALQDAIDQLAGAYQRYFDSNGSSGTKSAVGNAEKALNSICPGAAP